MVLREKVGRKPRDMLRCFFVPQNRRSCIGAVESVVGMVEHGHRKASGIGCVLRRTVGVYQEFAVDHLCLLLAPQVQRGGGVLHPQRVLHRAACDLEQFLRRRFRKLRAGRR